MKIGSIKIEAGLSKEQEKKILTYLRNAFKGTDNYLENFFSDEVLNMVFRQIDDDIIPSSVADRDKEVSQLYEDCKDRDKEIERLKRELGKAKADLCEAEEFLKDRFYKNEYVHNQSRELRELRFKNEQNEKLRVLLRDFLQIREDENNL